MATTTDAMSTSAARVRHPRDTDANNTHVAPVRAPSWARGFASAVLADPHVDQSNQLDRGLVPMTTNTAPRTTSYSDKGVSATDDIHGTGVLRGSGLSSFRFADVPLASPPPPAAATTAAWRDVRALDHDLATIVSGSESTNATDDSNNGTNYLDSEADDTAQRPATLAHFAATSSLLLLSSARHSRAASDSRATKGDRVIHGIATRRTTPRGGDSSDDDASSPYCISADGRAARRASSAGAADAPLHAGQQLQMHQMSSNHTNQEQQRHNESHASSDFVGINNGNVDLYPFTSVFRAPRIVWQWLRHVAWDPVESNDTIVDVPHVQMDIVGKEEDFVVCAEDLVCASKPITLFQSFRAVFPHLCPHEAESTVQELRKPVRVVPVPQEMETNGDGLLSRRTMESLTATFGRLLDERDALHAASRRLSEDQARCTAGLATAAQMLDSVRVRQAQLLTEQASTQRAKANTASQLADLESRIRTIDAATRTFERSVTAMRGSW